MSGTFFDLNGFSQRKTESALRSVFVNQPATDFVNVRLTDGSEFYTASGSGDSFPGDIIPLGANDYIGVLSPFLLADEETALTAPGTGDIYNCQLFSVATCSFVVANINTSVTVRLEGSVQTTGTNWFSLDEDGDLVIEDNGTYAITTPVPFSRIRFRFVSEAGGTDATITPQFYFQS